MQGCATYEDESLTVHFSCKWEKADFGVPQSPVWYEPTYIKIECVEILGVEVDPQKLPDNLIEHLYDLSYEVNFESCD